MRKDRNDERSGMSMKKKVWSILLCVVLVLGLLPVPVYAASVVGYITVVNIEEPVPGAKPDIAGMCAYTDNYKKENDHLEVKQIEWKGTLDAEGNFQAGQDYKLIVTVGITSGTNYAFGTSMKNLVGTISKRTLINGKSAMVESQTKDTVVLSYTYEYIGKEPAETIDYVRIVDIDEPQFHVMPDTTAKVVLNDDREKEDTRLTVSDITWEGNFDENGAFKAGEEYYVHVTVKIKDDVDAAFNKTFQKNVGKATQYASIKGAATIEEYSSKTLVLKGYYSKINGVSVDGVEMDRVYYTNTEAKALSTEKNLALTINSDDDWLTFNLDEGLNYSRLVLNNAKGEMDLRRFKNIWGHNNIYHIEEIWFSPDYDASVLENYIYTIDSSWGLQTGRIDSGDMNRGDCFVVLSADAFPNGYKERSKIKYGVRLYTGDIASAVQKGIKSTKEEPCKKHSYTQKIQTADRAMNYVTCTSPTRYYYSCEYCGKCEYNKKHTFIATNANGTQASEAFHDMGSWDITDAAYIGVNKAGQRVYWESCYACGKTYKQVQLDSMSADYKANYAASGELTYEQYKKMVKDGLAKNEKDALSGKESANMFVLDGKAVTAKVSKEVQSDVNWAKQNNILDESMMGKDYTKTMTRLQFCSVVVKTAEKMTGKTIKAAAASTYTDTTNKYVLKAYTAGITGGASKTKFSPKSKLNRQQMATFIYQALQYVKKNSDIRYTSYTSKLSKFTDSKSIASWAKEPMAFMNALGLMEGTAKNNISPKQTCTIEDALTIANHSLEAGEIGWYLVRTDRELRGQWVGPFVAFDGAGTNYITLTYAPGEKYWVTGIRKSDFTSTNDKLLIKDSYTGNILTAYKENFRAIREE